jgi:hypothetical protein
MCSGLFRGAGQVLLIHGHDVALRDATDKFYVGAERSTDLN